jgi:signal transduction histidine kinase
MTSITRRSHRGLSGRIPVTRDEVGQLAGLLTHGRKSPAYRTTGKRWVNVAHELRTLTNMQGYIEALIDGVVTPSKKPLIAS